ncbi:15-hydroxyprostaglandin dehydrogenase [NAD(+)]-like isoform X2 [Rhodnius prolixus]|uniref:15-hydroxyprostaglandin dehydrogenase [NAD(+)]-like isoform X2 n=1 Tax=Rhodnius prolixus TaxID=13249 RepID=UPI003D18C306
MFQRSISERRAATIKLLGKENLKTGCHIIIGIIDVEEKEGMDLCDSLNKTYGPGSCIFCKCDVSDETSFKKSFEKAIKEWGKVDVLVNNAGFWDDSPEGWRKSVDVNIGTITGSLLAVQYMGKNHGGNGGTVLNVASILGFYVYPIMPIYSSTKAAVLKFTRDMGTEHQYQLHGIKFIAMCPHGTLGSKFFANQEKKFVFSDANFIKPYYDIKFEKLQQADNVAKGIVESLHKGENGSVWVVEDEKGVFKIEVPEIEIMKI